MRLRLLDRFSRFRPLPGGVLDRQTALLRRIQEIVAEAPLDQQTPAQARRAFRDTVEQLKRIGGRFEDVHTVREIHIPGPGGALPARLYLPDNNEARPLFVLFHGGGWVLGDVETADNIARFLCRHAGCAVLSVEYRLAPEYPFPAAVEDASAACEWAAAHASELGGDAGRLLVGGDSAGGTLSAVVAQLAAERGEPRIAGQVLLYPGANASSLDTSSYREFGHGAYGLPKRDVEWFLDQYLPEYSDRSDPRASPLLSKDLRRLPPALVVTAEYDVLRDEGEEYANRMMDAGVNVRLMRCNGMVHGFLSMVGLIRRATDSFEQIATEIRKMVSG